MAEESKIPNELPPDLSSTTTAEERWALVTKLTAEEWARRGEPMGEMDKSFIRVFRIERDASGNATGRTWVKEGDCERLASPEESAELNPRD